MGFILRNTTLYTLNSVTLNICFLIHRLFAFDLWRNQKRMNSVLSCKWINNLVSWNAINWMESVCVCACPMAYPLSYFRSKLHTYDDVVERVAHHLGLDDPSKIRLTSHNCYSQQPKPQPIKYRGVDHLSDMLVHYNQVHHRRVDLYHLFFSCIYVLMAGK